MGQFVFIVGPSRSGTTVLAEALGKHSNIHQCQELHYYNLILPKLKELGEGESNLGFLLLKEIDSEKAFFDVKNNFEFYCDKLKKTSSYMPTTHMGLQEFFDGLGGNSETTIVEQTPMNLFYIDEIKAEFNDAIFIKMSRDVRSLLASQKHRWKIGHNGSENIPKTDIKRVKFSGHPIIQLLLLRPIVKQLNAITKHKDVINIQFEELVLTPNETLSHICQRINQPFEGGMLAVSDKGSSHDKEANSTGFSKKRSLSWRQNLTITEIWLCQKLYPELVEGGGIDCKPKLFEILFLVVTFPYCLIRALLLNKKSYGNLFHAIKARLV